MTTDKVFQYTRYTFKRDGTRHVEMCQMTRDALISRTGHGSEEAFLRLVNNWNRNGISGVERSGNVYVFVAGW